MDNNELYDKINKAANILSQKSRSGYGNYMIVNSTVAEYFKHLDLIKERQDKINKILRRIKDKKYGKI